MPGLWLLLFLMAAILPGSSASASAAETSLPAFPEKARFILSTDLSGDIDDAAAFGFLIEATQRGRGTIAAVVTDSPAESAAPAARAFLDAWGLREVPVGAYRGRVGDARDGPYARGVADAFGQKGRSRADFPDDVATLRRVYDTAPDRSIVFIAIGFLNSLVGLLRSPATGAPDSVDGAVLFERKTAYVVSVGANFVGNPDGATRWNWKHAPGAAEYVLNHMTRPFFWLPANEIDQAGFPKDHPRAREADALTGPEGLGWDAATNPIKLAFELARKNHPGLLADGLRRKAFDPAAVRFATDLDADLFGFHCQNVSVTIRDGHLRVNPERHGPFAVLRLAMPTAGNKARDYLDGILGNLAPPNR